MKIRKSFVSNSSTSSFILFGLYTGQEFSDLDSLYDQGIRHYESDEDGPCVGVPPSEMKLTETLAEFRDRIAKKLNDAGVECKPEDLKFTSGTYYR